MNAHDTKTTSRTNWERLAEMKDEEIDYSDIPPLTDQFFARARLELPNTVVLDSDILDWFKNRGENYTAEINAVLRHYIEVQEQAA